ncbi:MAG: IS3 family transposase, partial [Bacilli bacterium]|nr:IS3 family transposase [Bacilli bacterium]
EIKKYVYWYNNERIQKNLGYLSPVQYRLKYLS